MDEGKEALTVCMLQRDSLYRYSNVDNIRVNQTVNAPLTSTPIPSGSKFSITPPPDQQLPAGLTVNEKPEQSKEYRKRRSRLLIM